MISNYPAHPPRAVPRPQPRLVNLLALVSEMNGDQQLRQALSVPGTALLGIASDGVPLMIRLAAPDVTHVLISGARSAGKTEAVRTMLASIALYQSAKEIQFVILDPKGSSFAFLGGLKHLWTDIASAPEHALQHLRRLEDEREQREAGRRTHPRLVVVVDDVAEWMSHAGREFQVHLARLAQRGRQTGISLIICSNKANAADLNPVLRSNFPIRLIGKHAGASDGADRLTGRGDFILNASGERVRFQTAHLAATDLANFYTGVKAAHTAGLLGNSRIRGIADRLRR
jgi:S-DNA-T family DNA segregation ATPase FtsK/SpoIIIE